MRASCISLLCLSLLSLISCDGLNSPQKDATPVDDSGESDACKAFYAEQDVALVLITDLIVDGLAQVPEVTGFCASADGLSVEIFFEVEGVEGSLRLIASEAGSLYAGAEEIEQLLIGYDEVLWGEEDIYAGSVTLSPSSDGDQMQASVELEGTVDAQNIAITLTWTSPL